MSEVMVVFGGVYSNHFALRKLIEETERVGIRQWYCLGDLGAFGPNPDKTVALLQDAAIPVVQGNYDHSIGHDLADCQCGYTDALDNFYARLSYEYTYRKTSPENKVWLRSLPAEMRFNFGPYRVLLCHGSPRRTNEFLWETTTSSGFLSRCFDSAEADVIVGTHTGLHWHRALPGDRHFINCGVIGRPANDGQTCVWYTRLQIEEGKLQVDFVPLPYDYQALADEMRSEQLPEKFVETIETGWWTTCLEILPMKERASGRF